MAPRLSNGAAISPATEDCPVPPVNSRPKSPLTLPQETMLGALCHYITHADLKDFQPMKANFGILPPLTFEKKTGKRERGQLYADRALNALREFLVTAQRKRFFCRAARG